MVSKDKVRGRRWKVGEIVQFTKEGTEPRFDKTYLGIVKEEQTQPTYPRGRRWCYMVEYLYPKKYIVPYSYYKDQTAGLEWGFFYGTMLKKANEEVIKGNGKR